MAEGAGYGKGEIYSDPSNHPRRLINSKVHQFAGNKVDHQA